ncbi:hypothetical protein [Xanthomonas populi]|uniref:hypothetical protein n=1 Tax=Xanthomonas populi TaxID=53414 RepID=UPI001ABF2B04|nr:hypothetical protein [Xanthomonas populi]
MSLFHLLLPHLVLLDDLRLLQILLSRLLARFSTIHMSMEERPFVPEGCIDRNDVLSTIVP